MDNSMPPEISANVPISKGSASPLLERGPLSTLCSKVSNACRLILGRPSKVSKEYVPVKPQRNSLGLEKASSVGEKFSQISTEGVYAWVQNFNAEKNASSPVVESQPTDQNEVSSPVVESSPKAQIVDLMKKAAGLKDQYKLTVGNKSAPSIHLEKRKSRRLSSLFSRVGKSEGSRDAVKTYLKNLQEVKGNIEKSCWEGSDDRKVLKNELFKVLIEVGKSDWFKQTVSNFPTLKDDVLSALDALLSSDIEESMSQLKQAIDLFGISSNLGEELVVRLKTRQEERLNEEWKVDLDALVTESDTVKDSGNVGEILKCGMKMAAFEKETGGILNTENKTTLASCLETYKEAIDSCFSENKSKQSTEQVRSMLTKMTGKQRRELCTSVNTQVQEPVKMRFEALFQEENIARSLEYAVYPEKCKQALVEETDPSEKEKITDIAENAHRSLTAYAGRVKIFQHLEKMANTATPEERVYIFQFLQKYVQATSSIPADPQELKGLGKLKNTEDPEITFESMTQNILKKLSDKNTDIPLSLERETSVPISIGPGKRSIDDYLKSAFQKKKYKKEIEVISRDLFAISVTTFCNLNPNELFVIEPEKAFSSGTKFANGLQIFVENFVSKEKDPSIQKMNDFWLGVAEKCYEANDLNSAFAIFSAIAINGVNRMEREKIPLDVNNFKERLDSLQAKFSFSGNFKSVRAYIEANKDKPVVPLLSISTKDITFLRDGNPEKGGLSPIPLDATKIVNTFISQQVRCTQCVPDLKMTTDLSLESFTELVKEKSSHEQVKDGPVHGFTQEEIQQAPQPLPSGNTLPPLPPRGKSPPLPQRNDPKSAARPPPLPPRGKSPPLPPRNASPSPEIPALPPLPPSGSPPPPTTGVKRPAMGASLGEEIKKGVTLKKVGESTEEIKSGRDQIKEMDRPRSTPGQPPPLPPMDVPPLPEIPPAPPPPPPLPEAGSPPPLTTGVKRPAMSDSLKTGIEKGAPLKQVGKPPEKKKSVQDAIKEGVKLRPPKQSEAPITTSASPGPFSGATGAIGNLFTGESKVVKHEEGESSLNEIIAKAKDLQSDSDKMTLINNAIKKELEQDEFFDAETFKQELEAAIFPRKVEESVQPKTTEVPKLVSPKKEPEKQREMPLSVANEQSKEIADALATKLQRQYEATHGDDDDEEEEVEWDD